MRITFKKILKAFIPHGILKLYGLWKARIPRECLPSQNDVRISEQAMPEYPIRRHCVLLLELYTVHGECMPGLIKYLLDLDYNVDVVIRKSTGGGGGATDKETRNDEGLFSAFRAYNSVIIRTLTVYEMNRLLRSPAAGQYAHIILGSFYDEIVNNHLYGVDLFKLKPVCLMHNPDITHPYFKTNKIITEVPMDCFHREPPLVVNTHYFGEITKKQKARTTRFAALNTHELLRRNPYLLLRACDRLYEKGIRDFSVTLIGDGIAIPQRYHANFRIYSFLDFQSMFQEIAAVDFFLPLLDPASTSYLNKASGSWQLCYGFLKPPVFHSKFAAISGFTNANSIMYARNDALSDAMEQAITMAAGEYDAQVTALETAAAALYQSSLRNLKTALEQPLT